MKQIENDNLKLMVFKSAEDLGSKVNEHLLKMYGLDSREYTFLTSIKENFFSDGHLKVEINESIRGKDLFILTDIGNYSLTYKMRGFINHASPNDLIMELEDGIGACNSHAKSINIVMPLLYAGRQHRRNTRENLTCGMVLRQLDNMAHVKSLLTFDAHDQGVEHSVHNMEFDNFYATNTILKDFINDRDVEELKRIVFIAPDNGATGRRNVYLNSFNIDYIHREAGSFAKVRDYNTLVNGKYPITGHNYCGNDYLEGYTAIISDDMISSGASMFDVIDELNKRGVSNIYIAVTYALFTEGVDLFNEYYSKGKFKGIYTTNLSYINEEYKSLEWLHICDCSELMAKVIYNIHNDLSISSILSDKSQPIKMLTNKFNK